MSVQRKTPLKQRIADAEARAAQWLGDANEAREAGNLAKAEQCDSKSQYWLDRANLLRNFSERAAPAV